MSTELVQIIHCADSDGEVNTFNTEDIEKTFTECGNIPRPSVIIEFDSEEFGQQTSVVTQLQMHSASSKYLKLNKVQNYWEELPYMSGTDDGKPFIGNFCKLKHKQNHVEENSSSCNISSPSVITELEKPHESEEFGQQTSVDEQLQIHNSSSKYLKLNKVQNYWVELPYMSGTDDGKPFIGNFCKLKHKQNHVEENPSSCNVSSPSVITELEKPYESEEFGQQTSVDEQLQIHNSSSKYLKLNKVQNFWEELPYMSGIDDGKPFNGNFCKLKHKQNHVEENPSYCNVSSPSVITELEKPHESEEFGQQTSVDEQLQIHGSSSKYLKLDKVQNHCEELPYESGRVYLKPFTGNFYKQKRMQNHVEENPSTCHEAGKPIGDHAMIDARKCKPCGSYQNIFKKCRTEATSGKVRNKTKQRYPLKCGECGKQFATNYARKIHLRIHTGERPFKCTKCGEGFIIKTQLNYHMNVHTGNYPFACDYPECNFKSNTSSRLKLHKQSKHNARKLMWDCSKTFVNSIDLETHQLTHAENTVFMSKQPHSAFMCPSKASATNYKHDQDTEQDKVFDDDQCCKSLSERRLNAMFQPTRKNPFVCDVPYCRYACSQKRGLATHKHTKHLGHQSFICGECGVAFVHQAGRDVHNPQHPKCALCIAKKILEFQKHENQFEKSFMCSDCGELFDSHAPYRIHLRQHPQNYSFQCDRLNCSYRCRRRRDLLNHGRKCERPFTCSECGKVFTSKLQKKIHLRLHTGERPFKCTECGEGFATGSSLKFHMCIHTGIYPRKCDYPECDFKCTTNAKLRRHNSFKHSVLWLDLH